MKTRRFSDSIYGTHFVLMWDASAGRLNRAVKERYDQTFDEGDSDYLARCFEITRWGKLNLHIVIIMLTNWRGVRYPASVSALAHEVFHATEYVMDYRDIPHSAETSEAWAYYFDSTFQRCLDILNKS